MLTIGKLAARAHMSAGALHYYEQEKLIVPDAKSVAGYRLYRPDSLARIRFIKQAQQCGFTLAQIRELLVLQTGSSACCGDVRRGCSGKEDAARGQDCSDEGDVEGARFVDCRLQGRCTSRC